MHRYIWLTDTHLDKAFPWSLAKFLLHISRQKLDGIFLTGDISNGYLLTKHLKLLASCVKCPIYFVLGNHDYHFSSIEQTHQAIRELCAQYPNLIWMTEAGIVPLNEEVCLIGTEGWYDAEEGKKEYLRLTFDWWMTSNFRQLPNMEDRILMWRQMATRSALDIADKLEKAIEQGFKTIYLLTHFPCWSFSTNDQGTLMEKFWLPYNTNLRLGKTIEDVMRHHKKKHCTVLAGHTHDPKSIVVSRNIDARVGAATYIGLSKHNEQLILI